jgi:hypothetical protein
MISWFKKSAISLTCLGTCFLASEASAVQFEVFGEWLALKSTVDDTYFVVDSPITTAFPNGSRVNNDPKWHSGWRVGGTVAFGDCDWNCGNNGKFLLAYTNFSQKHTKTVAGDFLWATLGRPDLASQFENYAGFASSQLRNTYHRWDLLYIKEIANVCKLNADIQFGFEGVEIKYNQDVVYDSAVVDGFISERSRSWGFGPELGLGLNYELWDNSCCGFLPGKFSVNVLAAGSLLAGRFNTDNRQFTLDDELVITDFVNVKDHNTTRIIPALHSRFGIAYDLCGSWWGGGLEVGYEFNSYLRAIQRSVWLDDTADGVALTNYYNYDLQGLYVSLTVRF